MIIEGNWAEVNSEWRCLQNELGWCWEYSWNYKLFIIFVLHEKCIFLCFEGRARAEFSWGETAEKWSKLKEHWGWISTRKLVLEMTWKSLTINDQTKKIEHMTAKTRRNGIRKAACHEKVKSSETKWAQDFFFIFHNWELHWRMPHNGPCMYIICTKIKNIYCIYLSVYCISLCINIPALHLYKVGI